MTPTHDDDLTQLTRDELVDEVVRLREGIREHRDSSGHNLCWYHPALWELLPEQGTGTIAVPPWPVFMRGCIGYRSALDEELPDRPAWPHEFDDPAHPSPYRPDDPSGA